MSPRPPRVAVVGGGIAGLAAALRLRERLGPAAEIVVYEQQSALGGKLRTGALAGRPMEYGAETFRMRDPAGGESSAVALARRVGLGDQLVHPAPVPAALALDRRLHPIPTGTLLGIPADPAQVAEVAPVPAGQDRDAGRPLLGPDEDVSVGELVRPRLGDPLVDRLVDPLLGGVYAGRADTLSLAVTLPGLAAACRQAHTLTEAVRQALGAASSAAGRGPATGPVFGSIRGGLGRLVAAVAAASGATVRLGLPVRELVRVQGRWRLTVGSACHPQSDDVDAVVLATPARPAARLLAEVAPAAAAPIGELDYASVALVGFALPPGTVLPEQSGFLVPATEGLTVKAATFLTRKWPHLADSEGPVLVRASVGRYQEPEPLQLSDQALVAHVHAELAELLGGLPAPLAHYVQRWGGALPQYRPGHRDRVAAARAALPGTVAVAGAGYDGVGIPACVTSGQAAAEQVVAALPQSVA